MFNISTDFSVIFFLFILSIFVYIILFSVCIYVENSFVFLYNDRKEQGGIGNDI